MVMMNLNQSSNRIDQMVESGKWENQVVRILFQPTLLQLIQVEYVVAGIWKSWTKSVIDRGNPDKAVEWNFQLGMKMLE